MPAAIMDRSVRYPVTFIDSDLIKDLIAAADYEIFATTASDSASYIVEGVQAPGRTFFCRHKYLGKGRYQMGAVLRRGIDVILSRRIGA